MKKKKEFDLKIYWQTKNKLWVTNRDKLTSCETQSSYGKVHGDSTRNSPLQLLCGVYVQQGSHFRFTPFIKCLWRGKKTHLPPGVHVRVLLRTNRTHFSIRFPNRFKPFRQFEVHISKWTKHGFWTWAHCGVLRETRERRNKRSIVREPFSSKQSTRQAAGEILGQLTLSFIDMVPAYNQLNPLCTKPHWTHKAKRVLNEKTIQFGHSHGCFRIFFCPAN